MRPEPKFTNQTIDVPFSVHMLKHCGPDFAVIAIFPAGVDDDGYEYATTYMHQLVTFCPYCGQGMDGEPVGEPGATCGDCGGPQETPGKVSVYREPIATSPCQSAFHRSVQ